MLGTVKWFNAGMGYGFIVPNGGDRDVFVHITAVERAGLDTLAEGQTVEYDVMTAGGRQFAEHLKAMNGNGGASGGKGGG
jgi:CspA family cold shock protein